MIDGILSQIKAKVGDEAPKIEGLLSDIQKAYNKLEKDKIDIEEDYKRVEGESIGRKKTIRKLEGELKEKDSDIEEWKTKAENPDGKDEFESLKSENEKLKTQWGDVLNARRSEVQKKIEEYSKHPKWEKAKTQFKLPEEKDGKLQFDAWTDEDVETNYKELQRLQELEYFDSPGPRPDGFNPMQGEHGDVNFDKMETTDDIGNYLVDALKQ